MRSRGSVPENLMSSQVLSARLNLNPSVVSILTTLTLSMARGGFCRPPPPDKGIFQPHHRGDVLKAHRRFIHRNPVYLAEAVGHAGGGQRLDDGTALAAHFQEIEAEQREYLKLGDEIPLFIDDAHAVGIAVGSQAGVRLLR